MNQDRNRDQDMPNRQSNMEQAEGSRDTNSQSGGGADSERNRMDSEPSTTGKSGGISNRPLDRERSEQEQLPDRGKSQSEH